MKAIESGNVLIDENGRVVIIKEVCEGNVIFDDYTASIDVIKEELNNGSLKVLCYRHNREDIKNE